MPGPLQFLQFARSAQSRLAQARELERRWSALDEDERRDAQVELDRLRAAGVAVRERITAGPTGFAREMRAAYHGVEAEPVPEPPSLRELARELTGAMSALTAKLRAAEERRASSSERR
ncbi:hypothetical protein SK069_00185 [Patulibacter brassicae]|uniref:Uncharacterized protein n=1 Tax=Patulibacter brassicae TaxID=1705717 RepID=A0ABU4VDX2_9ACTN|nr:hypothetical protein [Patulibacter brassicae]MDX8149996.1 hypothetical protein [Patulibacter brassicae]